MGHTEASLDLSILAGLSPAGVLAEIVNDDGSMMRLGSPHGGLRTFAATHGLVLTSVQDIVAFRQRNPDGVCR
jgi:3,4-dihydroxy 2-butanone 4-phosphate synthase/GTP cyclohydrolase II